MDPRLLALIGVLFLGIGIFSLILARKRLQQARVLGQPAIWYKSTVFLTGLEYILLGVIIFLNLSKSWIPTQLQSTFYAFYTVILLLAVSSLLAIMFTLLRKPRQTGQALPTISNKKADTQSSEERAAALQRKRERRQKAAAARRRHAGKA